MSDFIWQVKEFKTGFRSGFRVLAWRFFILFRCFIISRICCGRGCREGGQGENLGMEELAALVIRRVKDSISLSREGMSLIGANLGGSSSQTRFWYDFQLALWNAYLEGGLLLTVPKSP